MSDDGDSLVLRIPRAVVPELPTLSPTLSARMHALLERNTDGALTGVEREELDALVEIAQYARILAMVAAGAQGG